MDVLKCNGRQFDFKGFDKVTGEIDFHNSSSFTSETSDLFPATDTNTGPEKKNMTCESVITLDQQAKEELSWCIANMTIYNGKSLLIVSPDLAIFIDASKKGWGASCQMTTTGSRWSSVEKAWHINVLELEAVRLAILSFTKLKKLNSIHLRIDNLTALSYLLNMGGTKNNHLIKTSKETWAYFIEENTFVSKIYTQSE